MIIYLIVLLVIPFFTQSIEYLYPVTAINQGKSILFIHQKSSDNIALWSWNRETKEMKPELLSRFNPAGVQLLSDTSSGFSFVDNGTVKIKLFHKRSPKLIALDEPIYNINIIHWIDQYCCYCSAQKSRYYSIFQFTLQGIVNCLISSKNGDCLYPQKIGNKLFYIERIKENYRIMQGKYPQLLDFNSYDFNDTNDFDIRVKNILDYEKNKQVTGTNSQQLINFKKQPIAFLRMISPVEGFVLEHDAYMDTQKTTIIFSYDHLVKIGKQWQTKLLFSFRVPLSLLLTNNQERLYESILPLLPKQVNNTIFFVDATYYHDAKNYNLNIFLYDLRSGTIKQKTFSQGKNQHYFAPLLVENTVYFGQVLEEAYIEKVKVPFLFMEKSF